MERQKYHNAVHQFHLNCLLFKYFLIMDKGVVFLIIILFELQNKTVTLILGCNRLHLTNTSEFCD